MFYAWDEIKGTVERLETSRLSEEFSKLEEEDGLVPAGFIITQKTSGYLNFLGMLTMGVSVGVCALVFNYLIFVWILHMSF